MRAVREALCLWLCWAGVAVVGARMAWREMWPEAAALLRRATAAGAFSPTPARAEVLLALRAAGWLALWVVLCTLWAALLLWSGRLIWAGAPLARALFG